MKKLKILKILFKKNNKKVKNELEMYLLIYKVKENNGLKMRMI